MSSIWANFNHLFEVFQGLSFAFLLKRKDVLRMELLPYITFCERKISFSIKDVAVITIIVTLHYEETHETVLL